MRIPHFSRRNSKNDEAIKRSWSMRSWSRSQTGDFGDVISLDDTFFLSHKYSVSADDSGTRTSSLQSLGDLTAALSVFQAVNELDVEAQRYYAKKTTCAEDGDSLGSFTVNDYLLEFDDNSLVRRDSDNKGSHIVNISCDSSSTKSSSIGHKSLANTLADTSLQASGVYLFEDGSLVSLSTENEESSNLDISHIIDTATYPNVSSHSGVSSNASSCSESPSDEQNSTAKTVADLGAHPDVFLFADGSLVSRSTDNEGSTIISIPSNVSSFTANIPAGHKLVAITVADPDNRPGVTFMEGAGARPSTRKSKLLRSRLFNFSNSTLPTIAETASGTDEGNEPAQISDNIHRRTPWRKMGRRLNSFKHKPPKQKSEPIKSTTRPLCKVAGKPLAPLGKIVVQSLSQVDTFDTEANRYYGKKASLFEDHEEYDSYGSYSFDNTFDDSFISEDSLLQPIKETLQFLPANDGSLASLDADTDNSIIADWTVGSTTTGNLTSFATTVMSSDVSSCTWNASVENKTEATSLTDTDPGLSGRLGGRSSRDPYAVPPRQEALAASRQFNFSNTTLATVAETEASSVDGDTELDPIPSKSKKSKKRHLFKRKKKPKQKAKKKQKQSSMTTPEQRPKHTAKMILPPHQSIPQSRRSWLPRKSKEEIKSALLSPLLIFAPADFEEKDADAGVEIVKGDDISMYSEDPLFAVSDASIQKKQMTCCATDALSPCEIVKC